ncbi:RidA family protein [Deltaproteobacteria bacterium TL4]
MFTLNHKKYKMQKTIITSTDAPAPVGPYSQAIQYRDLLFISGQIAINPKTGDLVTEPFSSQCRLVLDNLSAILKAGGSSLDAVLKVSIFLTDMSRFSEFNQIYNEYFEAFKPARSCVEVSALPKGVAIEIEAIAHT